METALDKDLQLVQYKTGSVFATLAVSGKTETYDVTEIPPAEYRLVQDAYPAVLQNLSLSTTIQSLDLACDLIYLSFNATAGTKYSAQLFDIQESLEQLCSTFKNKLYVIKEDALSILDRLNAAFQYLSLLEEDKALKSFSKIGDLAKNLESNCDDIKKATEAVSDKLKTISNQLEDQVAEDITTGTTLKESRRMMEEHMKAKQAIVDQLKTTLSELATQIREALDQYQTDVDREKVLNFFKGFVNGLTFGLAGLHESSTNMSPSETGTSSSANDGKAVTSADAKKKAEQAASSMGTAIQKDKAFYESLLEAREQDIQVQMEAAGTVGELQSQLEYNTKLQNRNKQAQAAIELAIYGINNITVELSNTDLFWSTLKLFCESGDFDQLGTFTSAEKDLEMESSKDRLDFYLGEFFLSKALLLIVGWTAMASICDQFLLQLQKTFTKVQNNIASAPTIEEAGAQVDDLNKGVRALIDKQNKDAAARVASASSALAQKKLKENMTVSS